MVSRSLPLLAVVLAVGCAKSGSAPDSSKKTVRASAYTSDQSPELNIANGPSATAFFDRFLEQLHSGTCEASQLTPAFKKIIAEPVFDADQALGYSDSAASNWLKHFQGKLKSVTIVSRKELPDVAFASGTALGEKPAQVLVRLTKSGGNWQVDWLSVSDLTPAPKIEELDAKSFAAHAFLQALLSRQDDLAAGAMSHDYKQKLAPALGSEKKPFNAGILKSKLNLLRGQHSSYEIAKVQDGTVSGTFIGTAKAQPFNLTLVSRGQNHWTVEGFTIP